MRAVNLIPAEERRGQRAPARTGVLPYALIGAMAVALLAVTALVLTGNTVREHEAEIETLEARQAAAEERQAAFASFATFQLMQAARVETVGTLAKSRFDWERVLREVALLLNDDAWFVKMTGTVSKDVTVEDDAGVQLREDVEGPAIEIVGCAPTHTAVARLITRLREIDGVTRVAVAKSERPGTAPTGGSDDATSEECRTLDFISRFEIVIAFDAVQVDEETGVIGTEEPAVRSALRDASGAGDDGGRGSAATSIDKAESAGDVVPGRGE